MFTRLQPNTCSLSSISRLIIRRDLLLLLTLSVLAGPLAAQNEGEMPALELGKPIERELKGSEAHSYKILLTANQFLHIVVEQKGIDVVVALFAPDGKKVAEVDSPNGTQGPEALFLVIQTFGNHRLEVRSLERDAPAGRYKANIEELRVATVQDIERTAGRQAFAEAEQLSGQETSESYRKAMDKYDEAIAHFLAAGDRNAQANALNNKGLAYVLIGEYQESLNYFTKARSIFRDVNDRAGEALTRLNFGFVYDELDEKQKALDEYLQVLPIFRDLGDRQGEAHTLINIGSLYTSLGESSTSVNLYTQALSLCQQLKNRDCEATAIAGVGRGQYALGDKQKAIDNYNQTLLIYREMEFPRGESTALFYLAVAYSDLGKRQKALDYFTQVLAVSRKAGFRDAEVATLNRLGVLCSDLGDPQRAIELFNQALSLSRLIDSPSEEANALYNIAGYESKRGDLEAARVRLESVLGIIESLRSKVAGEELRSSYFATVQEFYEYYVDLLMRLHKQQPSKGYDAAAIQGSERARARSLLELLAEAHADIRQGVDAKLVDSERSLRRQLNDAARQQMQLPSSPQSDEQAQTIGKRIESLTTELQQVEAQIRQTSPRYAALTQPQPLTLKQIQTQVLDEDTILLEYSLGKDRSYLWAVTTTSITSFELPKREEIEALARQVYSQLSTDKDWDTKTGARQRELRREKAEVLSGPSAAAGLSRMLLDPVLSQLGNKRLLVVADGALQYIPFAALPVPVGSGPRMPGEISRKRKSTANKYQPLVVEHEIVSLPSASTIAVLRKEVKDRKPADKMVAILADPVFESDDERLGKVLNAPAGPSLNSLPVVRNRELPLGMERAATESGLKGAQMRIPRLHATRDEAKQILSLVPQGQSKGSFDFDASRQTATSGELSKYRYVHFATHGFLDSLHPELSGLVLSMVDEKGNAQNGFLRAHEIFNLKLPAELVVLSACQTGLGKEIRGEGLVSLTRGFMYAGAPRVVVSLWNVNDHATAELMARFYRGMLRDDLRPAAALRAAQISLMNERKWKSPFYWAAFTVQGEWR